MGVGFGGGPRLSERSRTQLGKMFMSNEIAQAVQQITDEKNIPLESVIETVEAALAAAYRKDFGEKNQNIKVEFDLDTGGSRIFDVKEVVADELYEEYEKEKEARAASGESVDVQSEAKTHKGEWGSAIGVGAGGQAAEAEVRKFNPKTMIPLVQALAIKPDAQIGDEIRTELYPPESYGRMAAQTAKQVIIQKIREAERVIVFNDFKGQEGQLMMGTIQRAEARKVLVDFGKVTGVLLADQQNSRDHYRPGARMKFLLLAVQMTPRGPEILLSRSDAGMVREIFKQEIPEINDGLIEIKGIAREPGYRSKVAVFTADESIDPIGSCIGQRGSRINTIIEELGGEKIDIIPWSEDPKQFVSNSLSPAKVISIEIDEGEHKALVEVANDQLSLAIGKGGQNVRLAAKLTGWRIDIKGDEPEIEKVSNKEDVEKEIIEKKEE